MYLIRTARVATVQWFGKKSGAYPTSFNHQRSTKRPKSNAKMHVDQMACRLAQNRKHSLRRDHFRAKYRYFDDFSSTVFNHFPLEDFLKPTGIDQLVPQEPSSVKNSKSTNCPNFSFNSPFTGGTYLNRPNSTDSL